MKTRTRPAGQRKIKCGRGRKVHKHILTVIVCVFVSQFHFLPLFVHVCFSAAIFGIYLFAFLSVSPIFWGASSGLRNQQYSGRTRRRNRIWWELRSKIVFEANCHRRRLFHALCVEHNMNVEWDRLTDNAWNAPSSSSSSSSWLSSPLWHSKVYIEKYLKIWSCASLPEQLLCRVRCSPWWSPCTPPCRTLAGCRSCRPGSPPPWGGHHWTHIVIITSTIPPPLLL